MELDICFMKLLFTRFILIKFLIAEDQMVITNIIDKILNKLSI